MKAIGVLLLLLGNLHAESTSDSLAELGPSSCNFSFLPEKFTVSADAESSDLDGRKVEFTLKWIHNSDSYDSIFIKKEDQMEWAYLYIHDKQSRMLYIGNQSTPRKLAYHHLRERIWETPLRWEDLDMMVRNTFECDFHESDTTNHLQKIDPKNSQVWHHGGVYAIDEESPADSIYFKNSRYINKWKFEQMFLYQGFWLPTAIELGGTEALFFRHLEWDLEAQTAGLTNPFIQ